MALPGTARRAQPSPALLPTPPPPSHSRPPVCVCSAVYLPEENILVWFSLAVVLCTAVVAAIAKTTFRAHGAEEKLTFEGLGMVASGLAYLFRCCLGGCVDKLRERFAHRTGGWLQWLAIANAAIGGLLIALPFSGEMLFLQELWESADPRVLSYRNAALSILIITCTAALALCGFLLFVSPVLSALKQRVNTVDTLRIALEHLQEQITSLREQNASLRTTSQRATDASLHDEVGGADRRRYHSESMDKGVEQSKRVLEAGVSALTRAPPLDPATVRRHPKLVASVVLVSTFINLTLLTLLPWSPASWDGFPRRRDLVLVSCISMAKEVAMLVIQASFLINLTPSGTVLKVALFSLACSSLQFSMHFLAKLLFMLSPANRKLRSSDYWATVRELAPPPSPEQVNATNDDLSKPWMQSKSGLHVELPRRPSGAARRPSGASRASLSGVEQPGLGPAGWKMPASRDRRASAGDPGTSRLGILHQGSNPTRKRGLSNPQVDTGGRSRRDSNAQVGDVYTSNI